MVKAALVVLEMSLFPNWICEAIAYRNGDRRECVKRFKSWEQGHRWLLKNGYEVCDAGPALYNLKGYGFQAGPALPASVPMKFNGLHWYHETKTFIVFAHVGAPYWTGMAIEDGDYQFIVAGQCPDRVLEATQAARALPRDQRKAYVERIAS